MSAPLAPLPTGIRLTALDPEFREDPYPILAEIRRREPIHRDEELGRVLFTRHDDVARILRDPDYWSDPRKGVPDGFARRFLVRNMDEEPNMLLMDDPGHRRLRELVRHPFAPRAVARWTERVRAVATRVIDSARPNERGEIDLIAAIANPIPTVVIAELLGIDPEQHDRFKAWSDAVVKTAFSPIAAPEDVAAADAAREALGGFFLGEIERRRSAPGDDLVSAMVSAEAAGDRLSNEEIVSLCTLLLLAGNVTTSDLIGNAVRALLRHPAELAKLRAQPGLMANTIEEALRYDSPVTNSGRIAHRAFEYDGVKIREGESLIVSTAAANRDPAIYPDPDRFDIEREDTHHQAFGGGRHFCLGAHLARLEASETLAVLLGRFPRLAIGEGGHVYAANPTFRGLSSFWVRVAD